ncbi:hypothetical protein lerEdw1_001964 [Lerista edwardsae]|nr:hypothetical protein lerEdw1_001964 [Lerista edwardsae]
MWLFMAVVCLIQQVTDAEGYFRQRHLNPQESMTISEIIKYWKYPSEKYEILTYDGYYLEVDRIPYGMHSPGNTGPKPVALMLHGVQLEGRCWLANLPNNSLGFVLADAGYDVWILNNRGTTWSRRHQYLSIDQEEFWDFSFHEMGIIDLPAAIDFILQKTKQDSLYLMGQSQGGTLGFIALSVLPELAKKVKLLLAFGPTYTLTGYSPSKIFLSLPDRLKTYLFICSLIIIREANYENISYLFSPLHQSRADVYLGIFPDYTSTKTMVHWGQIARSKEFRYFDYGSKNKAVYNMTTPPLYKIEDVTVPIAVWYAGNDLMAEKTDVERLLPRIPRLAFHKFIPSWEHADFMWGLDAPKRLFPDVLHLMQKYR